MRGYERILRKISTSITRAACDDDEMRETTTKHHRKRDQVCYIDAKGPQSTTPRRGQTAVDINDNLHSSGTMSETNASNAKRTSIFPFLCGHMGATEVWWRKKRARGGMCIQLEPGRVHGAPQGRRLASFWVATVCCDYHEAP
jgi:hypothetical protein